MIGLGRVSAVYLTAAVVLVLGLVGVAVFVVPEPSPGQSGGVGTATTTPEPTVLETATSTPSFTPTQTVSPTTTATPTSTRTRTPRTTQKTAAYQPFIREYLLHLNQVGEDLAVTVELRGSRFAGEEFWVVFDFADSNERSNGRTAQLTTALNAYWKAYNAYFVGKIGGEAPNRYRVLEVNNTHTAPKTSTINNSLLERHANEEISQDAVVTAFADNYRNQTTRERRLAREIDRAGRNKTVGDTDDG